MGAICQYVFKQNKLIYSVLVISSEFLLWYNHTFRPSTGGTLLPVVRGLIFEFVADKLFHHAYVGFRRFCIESEALPVDLHIVLSDVLQEAGTFIDKYLFVLIIKSLES